MTTATVGALLDRAADLLESLMRRYESLAQDFASRAGVERKDELAAQFAAFLGNRERETIAVLEEYRADEHPIALEVHVRLGSGFPFQADELAIPEHPSLDELMELAERTDTLLEQLCERIQVYAASRPLAEILTALEQIVGTRRRQLSGALNELEEFRSSPPQSHS